MFTFREILNLAKEFGRSLPGKHLIPRYFNIDRYERQKYGLISMCILSFDTSTTTQVNSNVQLNLLISSFFLHIIYKYLTFYVPGTGSKKLLLFLFSVEYLLQVVGDFTNTGLSNICMLGDFIFNKILILTYFFQWTKDNLNIF